MTEKLASFLSDLIISSIIFAAVFFTIACGIAIMKWAGVF